MTQRFAANIAAAAREYPKNRIDEPRHVRRLYTPHDPQRNANLTSLRRINDGTPPLRKVNQ